jgi:hypothetical protein
LGTSDGRHATRHLQVSIPCNMSSFRIYDEICIIYSNVCARMHAHSQPEARRTTLVRPIAVWERRTTKSDFS